MAKQIRKNPSLITLVYLQMAVSKLEYFLSSSPVQETQYPAPTNNIWS